MDKRKKQTGGALTAGENAADIIKASAGNPQLLRLMDRIVKISLDKKPIKKKAKGGIVKKRYGGSVKKKTKKKT
tara:strand:- start:12 stop:233 length:222 start_codon:yes stop_codon:yes gene_type:complete